MSGERHLQDCYFFYYSKCNKGDACDFRHERAALGCETMCTEWQQSKCTNAQCPLRHMQLKKNRKSIPCYWESQPGGCQKPHCAFFHKVPRQLPVNVLNGQGVNGVNPQAEQQANPNRPAEALLVNFQESMQLY